MSNVNLFKARHSEGGVIHLRGCRYLRKKSLPVLIEGLSPHMVLASDSLFFCPCCSPVSVQYRKEKEALNKYAHENGLRLSLDRGVLRITCSYSSWLIAPDIKLGDLCVYHKNVWGTVTDPIEINNYHVQYARRVSLLTVLTNIIEHDNYRRQLEAAKQSELDRLREAARQAALKQIREAEMAAEQDRIREAAYQAEQDRIFSMAREASDVFRSKQGRKKNCDKHYTRKSRKVLAADTSDWDAFRALFKLNAAE